MNTGRALETRNCLACGAPAKLWGGHVHQGPDDKEVIAGWCHDHRAGKLSAARDGIQRHSGCYGNWQERDGIRKGVYA